MTLCFVSIITTNEYQNKALIVSLMLLMMTNVLYKIKVQCCKIRCDLENGWMYHTTYNKKVEQQTVSINFDRFLVFEVYPKQTKM